VKQGYVDLSSTSEIYLPIEIQSGTIKDVTKILEKFTSKLSWFPTTLVGDLRGKVEIAGELDFDQMDIVADIVGSDWAWMGERARKVSLQCGVSKGVLFAKDLDLIKTNGRVLGFVRFDSLRDRMSWDLRTEDLSFTDIDFIDRLEIPARSKIAIKSVGEGPIKQLSSKMELALSDTFLKGEALAASKVTVDISEKTFQLDARIFGNKLEADMKYALTPKQPSRFALQLNQFDFSPVLIMLNPRLIDDRELKALIDGSIDLEFLSTQSELARGSLELRNYQLHKSDFSLDLMEPVQLPIQLGFFSLKPATFKFKDSQVIVSGEGNRGNLDLKVD